MAKGCTVYFECDLSDIRFNPLMVETPFGKPKIVSTGNVFEERDKLIAELDTVEGDSRNERDFA